MIRPLFLVLDGLGAVARAGGQIPDVTASQHPNLQSPTTNATTMFPHLASIR